jgi:hypothetical protein
MIAVLQVDSEATVLYAAQHYINKLKGEPKAAAIQVLGPLIRCQFLSSSWLTSVAEGAVSGTAPGTFVLEKYAQPALQLLKRRLSSAKPSLGVISKYLPHMPLTAWPDSWFVGPRQYTAQDSVQLTQQVDVSQLREAAVRCAQGKKKEHLNSRASGPIQGLTWQLSVSIDGTNSAGTRIGVFAGPAANDVGFITQPAYSFSYRATADVGDRRVLDKTGSAPSLLWKLLWGPSDAFGLGYMSGGWDEAAWAAAGLPSSGSLSFNLSLKIATEV